MKKNVFIVLGLLISLASVSVVLGQSVSPEKTNAAVAKQKKVPVEQARKNALKKVDGNIEDEFTIEDEDESVTAYVFIIKNKQGKTFEVQIDAENGAVLSSEEYVEDSDEDTPIMDAETPAVIETGSTEVEIVETADSQDEADNAYENTVEVVEATDETPTTEVVTEDPLK